MWLSHRHQAGYWIQGVSRRILEAGVSGGSISQAANTCRHLEVGLGNAS
jgi:hypothetical protein